MSLNETPRGNRVHIGFFGKRNSGKSSLINALTGQTIAIVSDVPGTTTDPVYKSMEIKNIGPCVLIDTAGFDDIGTLGKKRIAKTEEARAKADIGVIVIATEEIEEEIKWAQEFQKKNIPVVFVATKGGLARETISEKVGKTPIVTEVNNEKTIENLREAIIRSLPEEFGTKPIIGNLAAAGDTVMLVMPQDIQAPKGRLILPQVQTTRELLDKQCIVISTTAAKAKEALEKLKAPPKLIVTDSQVFEQVYKIKPEESLLTSFSILFAAHKGDIDYYIESARAIDSLTEKSKILIAEACTHAPLGEDIGREKIPAALRKKVGEKLSIDIVSGSDFPDSLAEYDLIIHCGACMFNRSYVLSRTTMAKKFKVPMTNYGIVLAHIQGILDKISY